MCFSLGKITGKQPWAIVSLSFIFAGLCAVGMIKFAHENRNEKLWNAKDSLAQKHKKWVEDKFPSKTFVSTVLFTSDDVLTPEVMNAVSTYFFMGNLY